MKSILEIQESSFDNELFGEDEIAHSKLEESNLTTNRSRRENLIYKSSPTHSSPERPSKVCNQTISTYLSSDSP